MKFRRPGDFASNPSGSEPRYDAEPELPTSRSTAFGLVPAPASALENFAEMLAVLPDVEPAPSEAHQPAAPSAARPPGPLDLPTGSELSSAATRTARPASPVGGKESPPPIRYVHLPAASGVPQLTDIVSGLAGEWPVVVVVVPYAVPVVPGAPPFPQPLAAPVGFQAPPAVPFRIQPVSPPVLPPAAARSSSRPKSPTPHSPAVAEQPGGPGDGQSLSQKIMDQLEKHNMGAVSQLRIEVHGGIVVVAGEVPTAYEKQLIAHFCRQVPGVVTFVDSMIVRERAAASTAKGRARGRRPARDRYGWQLPFRVWHAGLAAGLMIMIWTAYSYATRDPSKLSVSPVSGTVVFEGNSPEGASITLLPLDRSQTVRPRGTVAADGSFEISTYVPGDGAPHGEYKVMLEWRKLVEVDGDLVAGPNLLPEAYSKPDGTPVRVTVEGGQNEFPIEIKK